MNRNWNIQMLGEFEARCHGLAMPRFRTQKTGALFAFLVYHPDQAHPRERLTEILWEEDDYESARHKLSVALSWLRQQLEPPGVPDHSVLSADKHSVRLNGAAFSTDVAEFQRACAAAERARDPTQRLPWLQQAVDLYQGVLLPGYYEDWILPEQRRLELQFLEAQRALIEGRERAGDYPAAIRCALRVLAVDPHTQGHHAQLMRLYLAFGQPELAARQYREARRMLGGEGGFRPGAELRELAERLERGVLSEGRSPAGPVSAGSAAALPEVLVADGCAAEADDPAGGAVPLDSPFYVTRPADEAFLKAVARRNSLVLVKGAREVGKTSLLARGLHAARESGARVMLSDFQLFNAAQLASAEALLQVLARSLAEQLEAPIRPAELWDPEDGPNVNFRRFIRRLIAVDAERPLVWGLDEVDRLFSFPYGTEIFALFRTWHNERALDPHGPWSRLTLAIAYATEVHLFITDLNQSPFNVGTRLTLEDFTLDQVADLNRRYGAPLATAEELGRYFRLVGGHPYLVRRGLQEMRDRGARISEVEKHAVREDWIFGEHLRRLRSLLARDPALIESVVRVLGGRSTVDLGSFYRLRSAGVIVGPAPGEARPRSLLYARYLEAHFADAPPASGAG